MSINHNRQCLVYPRRYHHVPHTVANAAPRFFIVMFLAVSFFFFFFINILPIKNPPTHCFGIQNHEVADVVGAREGLEFVTSL